MDPVFSWLLRDEMDGITAAHLEGRVGSPFVPRTERLRQYFGDLIARLEELRPGDLNAWIRAHNLYTVYVYLVLMWATAIRPHCDPLITRESLRGPRGWIIIADKDNGTFRERRPVPVCTVAWKLLVDLEQSTDTFCRWLASVGHPISFDEQLLFVIIRETEGKALTPELARTVLHGEALEYPWKFNSARHYWVSTWLAMERPLARIEAFLGHVHEGTEPWGPFSLASLFRWGEDFRERGEEILELIGARMLVHPFNEEHL